MPFCQAPFCQAPFCQAPFCQAPFCHAPFWVSAFVVRPFCQAPFDVVIAWFVEPRSSSSPTPHAATTDTTDAPSQRIQPITGLLSGTTGRGAVTRLPEPGQSEIGDDPVCDHDDHRDTGASRRGAALLRVDQASHELC